MSRAVAAAVALVAVGCITPSPPAEPDLAPRAVAAPPPQPRPKEPLPAMAECELGGEVARPKGASGRVHAWIADGPCWAPTTRAFGETTSPSDKFFSEVFVPQGTQLWVCAALVDGKKPITVYGQLDRSPLLGKGFGEVAFMNLKIALAKGKAVKPPEPRPRN